MDKRYPASRVSAAELVDYPNRRRHSKRRAGTVKSSASTVSAAPAGYASDSNHSGSTCQELAGFSVFLLDGIMYRCSHKRPALFCVREVFMAATAVVEPAHEPTKTGSPLLDRLWHAARSRGDSAPTADLFAAWARRFILFHDRRHPRELGLAHVTHFLEHVAKAEREPLPALAQARAALALLYERVVGADLGELPWPRPPRVLDQLRLLLRVRHYSRSTED
jgi:hypothetical protein